MSNYPNRHVKVMNGLPLVLFTVTDFGTPGRRDRWGNHTTLEAALRVCSTATRDHSYPMGKIWVEDARGNVVAGPYWAGGPRPHSVAGVFVP